jgi:hypothetical protein
MKRKLLFVLLGVVLGGLGILALVPGCASEVESLNGPSNANISWPHVLGGSK